MPPLPATLQARLDDLNTRYRHDSRLTDGTVYSLPPSFVQLLSSSRFELLTREEAEFERRLRSACGTGLRHGSPFATIVLDQPVSDEEDFPRQLWASPVVDDTDLLDATMDGRLAAQRHGEGSRQAQAVNAIQTEVETHIRYLMRGYVAWLIHNATFRDELWRLKNAWKKGPSWEMPTSNADVLDPHGWRGRGGPEAAQWRDQAVLASQFLRRWSLARLETWDLPVPVAADTLMTRTPAIPSLGATQPFDRLNDPAGMSLFLPWWLFVDRDFSISRFKEYHAARLDLTRFQSWLEPKKKNGFGFARYEMLLDVHVYLNLALRVRYPEMVSGNIGRLDQAFARWMGRRSSRRADAITADSIKRIRTYGARLLRVNADVETGEPSSQSD